MVNMFIESLKMIESEAGGRATAGIGVALG